MLGSQSIPYRNQLSLSIPCAPGLEHGLSGLAASSFTHWAIFLALLFGYLRLCLTLYLRLPSNWQPSPASVSRVGQYVWPPPFLMFFVLTTGLLELKCLQLNFTHKGYSVWTLDLFQTLEGNILLHRGHPGQCFLFLKHSFSAQRNVHILNLY